MFFSEICSIYSMFLKKHYRIIIISASQEQSNRILEEIKTLIDNNEWLITKKNSNKWASSTIGYNDGYILTAGIGSEILGQHVDRIVIDDILRSDNKLTDQQVEDYIDMNLDPMLLNRDGQMIIVGTPRSSTDIFTTIEMRIKDSIECPWKMYRFPAILDYDKKILLAPDRFTWKQIMDKRLSMGALKFAREYQLEFFSRDTSLFPQEYIKRAKTKGKDYKLLDKAQPLTPNWLYVMGVDVARSGTVSADYTVAFVIAYDSISQEKRLAHAWREKGLKLSEQSQHIADISRKFNNCMVVVETNNMGQDMVDRLVDDYNVYVEPYTLGSHAKKEEIIRFLISSFENEQIALPMGDEDSRAITSIVEDELSKFCTVKTPAGNERFEGIGAHDDCVMALAYANKASQIIGVPFAVASEKGSNSKDSSPYKAFTVGMDRDESDIINKIRLGLIK